MEALPVQSDSDCPSPLAVQAEVRELTTLEQRQNVASDAKVFVSDRGDSIAIAVTRDGKTTVRIYQDAARDCARRSHFVSVLAVVSLMPPDLGSAEPEPEPEPEPGAREQAGAAQDADKSALVARSEPEPAKAPPKRVRIELGARVEGAAPIADTTDVTSVGGALGVALGTGNLRFTLATGYMPRSELRFTGAAAGRAELERLDVAVGMRLGLGYEPLETSLDVGALATRAEVTGLSSRRPTQDTAFSIGGRVGLSMCWSGQGLVSPFVSAYASVFPLAPALSQLPQGTVGHLPYLWLGLNAGLSLAL